MLLGYHLDDYANIGVLVPVNNPLAFKNSNILVAGKSGSGKSLCCLWYIYNMLSTEESCIYIADYKGGKEYAHFNGSHSYASGEEAIEMIANYYKFFTTIRNRKILLEEHYTLCIEEWFGLLSFAETKSKKLKTELLSQVGEILAVGRGINIGLMLVTQRADASNFSTGARDQFHCIINFGRASREQYQMLGFSSELDENPSIHFKSGMALCLCDNQDGVVELIVPLIKNQQEMGARTRVLLDRQTPLSLLAQEIADGKRLS